MESLIAVLLSLITVFSFLCFLGFRHMNNVTLAKEHDRRADHIELMQTLRAIQFELSEANRQRSADPVDWHAVIHSADLREKEITRLLTEIQKNTAELPECSICLKELPEISRGISDLRHEFNRAPRDPADIDPDAFLASISKGKP